MREVSGVTGAGPILHAIFDYLHTNYGTSWYRNARRRSSSGRFIR